MCRFHPPVSLCLGCLVGLLVGTSNASDLAGVVVTFEKYEGPATIVAQSVAPYKLKIVVDPKSERERLAIRVELPATGRKAWPAADVEVRDARGKAMAVRRSGIEWHHLLIPVPPVADTYFVQAVDPPRSRPAFPAEQQRHLTDETTGLSVTIARWHDGRQAALSIRFDDSHPSHLSKAIPILRGYGFRGTFMINPGEPEANSRRRSAFADHRAEWEAVAKRGDQEFANHSAHHRGAIGDADMEAEVGDAAKAIWKLFPGKSKLTALNLGGGTVWETTHTLRYYLDKYHQFDASQNSLGMDDSYGNRVATFRRMLEQHIQRGLWCRIHYHYIGAGLSSSEANFRAALDIAKEHEAALWIAGLADVYKYQTERSGSALSLVSSDARHLSFKLSCLTDPELYDQPLTIEVAIPKSWPADRIVISDGQSKTFAFRTVQHRGQIRLRFELAPRSAAYTITLTP
jgi:hypothetical protein